MGVIATAIRTVFRNWVADGVPSSGVHRPKKADIQGLGDIIEAAIAAGDADLSDRIDAIVDIATAGYKPPLLPVRLLATSNVSVSNGLENADTLDGETLVTGDRVALTGQSTASQNGIYVVPASGTASRATDADTAEELLGARFQVSEGTHAGEVWAVKNTGEITVGSTAITIEIAETTSATAQEVIDARGGHASLGDRLDDIESASDDLSDVLSLTDTGTAEVAAGSAVGFGYVPEDGLYVPGMLIAETDENLYEVVQGGHAVMMYMDGDGQLRFGGASGAATVDIPDGPSQEITAVWVEPWDNAAYHVVVSWISDSQTGKTLYHRIAESNLWIASGSQWTRPWPYGSGKWVHSVLLRDLSPGTIYDIGWVGADDRKKFRTANRFDVKIAWASDWHRQATNLVTASTGIVEERPDLIILPGDLAQDDFGFGEAEETYWLLLLNQLSNYWTQDGAIIPIAMTPGNHDFVIEAGIGAMSTICSAGYEVDQPRRRNGGTYRIDVGSEVAIILLETGWRDITVAEQVPWIEEQIADAYETHRHIVVTGHWVAFGVSDSHPQFDTHQIAKDLRFVLWPAMTQYADKVRFYLCGHEHMFNVTAPLVMHYDSGQSDEDNYFRWTTEDEDTGVRQLGNGSIGGSRFSPSEERAEQVSSIDGSIRHLAVLGRTGGVNHAIGDVLAPDANPYHYWISTHNSDGTWTARAISIDGSLLYEIPEAE